MCIQSNSQTAVVNYFSPVSAQARDLICARDLARREGQSSCTRRMLPNFGGRFKFLNSRRSISISSSVQRLLWPDTAQWHGADMQLQENTKLQLISWQKVQKYFINRNCPRLMPASVYTQGGSRHANTAVCFVNSIGLKQLHTNVNQSSFISGMTERKPAIHKSNTHIAIVQELHA